LEDGTAVVVAADIIGLDLIPASRRDPMLSSSRGLAAPILAAVRDGARKIVVFLGGVATVDAGLGLLSALGADPRDIDGRPLATTANNLAAVHTLELSEARSALSGIELVAATDVGSPLHGPDGAAHRFAAQKGADPTQQDRESLPLRGEVTNSAECTGFHRSNLAPGSSARHLTATRKPGSHGPSRE
jgi:glycerate kinase